MGQHLASSIYRLVSPCLTHRPGLWPEITTSIVNSLILIASDGSGLQGITSSMVIGLASDGSGLQQRGRWIGQ